MLEDTFEAAAAVHLAKGTSENAIITTWRTTTCIQHGATQQACLKKESHSTHHMVLEDSSLSLD